MREAYAHGRRAKRRRKSPDGVMPRLRRLVRVRHATQMRPLFCTPAIRQIGPGAVGFRVSPSTKSPRRAAVVSRRVRAGDLGDVGDFPQTL